VTKIQEARGVEAELVPGKGGIFDVVVDGKLIYSKHQTGRFPDPDEILAKLG
jgi:selenoprotein W-related protein